MKIYDDSGTGADDDVSVWRPQQQAAQGFWSLGDVAMDSHDEAPRNAFLVKEEGTVLAPPTDYREVWDDRGSGGDIDGSIWEPISPAGYTCLGAVATNGYTKPSLNAIRCLRSDLTILGKGSKVWDDAGSGADEDVSIWQADARDYTGLTSSTFHASSSHSAPSSSPYRVLDKRKTSLFSAVAEQGDHGRAVSLRPTVNLAPSERYNPSSVGFFLENTHSDGGYLTTNTPLGCASCTDPAFLNGQEPGRAPMYAEIIPKTDREGRSTSIVDTIYWMFYPYNNGKRVCIGVEARGTCLGGWATFGNHVGDWEHLTVRSQRGLPYQVVLSQHSGSVTFAFGDKHLRLGDLNESALHVEVFSAEGAHALYPDSGDHTYQKIFSGSRLVDVTGYGTRWSGEPLITFAWHPAGTYAPDLVWMNLTERWGNAEDGCDIKPEIGECTLNAGPTPPQQKDFAQPPLDAPVG
ncbi:Vps62-related protein [Streptomyces sp. 1222.5]|uniref:Vps62-related protein n=1 Tax=Streptomyces sp. 1222.5 TaxID=1881026 RepID=UPI003EC0AB3B